MADGSQPNEQTRQAIMASMVSLLGCAARTGRARCAPTHRTRAAQTQRHGRTARHDDERAHRLRRARALLLVVVVVVVGCGGVVDVVDDDNNVDDDDDERVERFRHGGDERVAG